MEPLLGFGASHLAADDGYPHYGLRRDEAVVVVGFDFADSANLLVVVNSRGHVFSVATGDAVIANPAGPSWTPEWIAEMTERRLMERQDQLVVAAIASKGAR